MLSYACALVFAGVHAVPLSMYDFVHASVWMGLLRFMQCQSMFRGNLCHEDDVVPPSIHKIVWVSVPCVLCMHASVWTCWGSRCAIE